MPMTREGFLKRLQAGKSVRSGYHKDEFEGLISAWLHGSLFILTWEECPRGDAFNEHLYTRDERHLFETAEELLAFVEERGYTAADFRP
jgi:hypothetical protein